jgi:exopolysaccharide biosynthesis polyprenyl glycosylphosphotransferase
MIRVFRVFVPASVLVLIVSEFLLLFFSYVAAAYLVFTQIDPVVFLLYDDGFARIATVVVIIMLGLYFNDLYGDVRIKSRVLLLQQLCMAVGIAFVTQSVFSYGNQDWTLPKWMMINGSAIAIFLAVCWRVMYSHVVLSAMGAERVLFIGASEVVFETAQHLENRPELGMAVLGFLDENCPPEEEHEAAIPRLGCIGDLKKVVAEFRPERIVVGLQERRRRLPVNDLLDLRFAGVNTQEISYLYEIAFARVCTREIRPSHLIFSTDLGPRPHQVQIQAFYSLIIAAIGLVLVLPAMLLVAVLVRLTSAGPVLFRQTRVGLHDVPFTLYKFRSMYVDAEATTGAVWATKGDPRITPLGRWLRLLRLDELPQLFNVLRGEMSIVGPRPERPEFVHTLNEQIPFYRQRHCVKPGITGWAQVSYKYGNTIEDTITKLEYDLYYIKNMSVALDAYIVFHTMKTMLLFRGAQ